jgi:hypothetical protein
VAIEHGGQLTDAWKSAARSSGIISGLFFSKGVKTMAEEESKTEGKGFTVQDRRRFSDTGDVRESVEEAPAAANPQAPSGAAQNPEAPERRDEPFPEINFSTFVISLSTQALMHLGEIPNPASGNVEKDLPVAKQMIDIVGMLKDKTRGNLNNGEEKLIVDILFDLRMRYVEAVKHK